MKEIRILKVVFDTEIEAYELPAFRAALADKAGWEHDLFHNHAGPDKVLYRYPLIQYKRYQKKPILYCLEAGVDQAYHFFQNKSWKIRIGEKELNLKVDKLDLRTVKLGVWQTKFRYRMWNWVGLNPKNYQLYTELDGMKDRIDFLEKKLIGNILSFAKGLEWRVEEKIEVEILDLSAMKTVRVKQTKLSAFDVTFQTNVSLPQFTGLGKSSSIGYGMLKTIRKKEDESEANDSIPGRAAAQDW